MPLVYRVHDEPAVEKLHALREFLATLDISLPKGGVLRPEGFNRVLDRIRGRPAEALVNEVVLRSRRRRNTRRKITAISASISSATPISRRRSAATRTLSCTARSSARYGSAAAACRHMPTSRALGEIAARISAAERRAMAAERETVERLIAHFLADRIGASFAGRIGGVTRAGLFVKLDDTGADGFIPAATLGQ